MCNFFDDDFDALDFANLAFMIETQLEGEREEKEPEEPSPDDPLDFYDPFAEDEQDVEKTDYDDE